MLAVAYSALFSHFTLSLICFLLCVLLLFISDDESLFSIRIYFLHFLASQEYTQTTSAWEIEKNGMERAILKANTKKLSTNEKRISKKSRAMEPTRKKCLNLWLEKTEQMTKK